MTPDTPRRTNLQHLTSTGSALAGVLLPLAVGVLLAKTMAGDPLAPVNALITSGRQRTPISPSHWHRCGRTVLSGWNAERQITGADTPGPTWRRIPPTLEAKARAYAERHRPGRGGAQHPIGATELSPVTA